jgi:hypothetical protein
MPPTRAPVLATLLTVLLTAGPSPAATLADTEALLNWLEDSYPNYAAPRRPATQTVSPYTFRYYSDTQSYVGVSTQNEHLYYLSTPTGLLDLGPLSAFDLPPVEVVLCESISTDPTVHQGVITPINPTLSFNASGTDQRNNVYMVLRFQPFGRSVGLRVLLTQDTPDGRFEQDRVLSMAATPFNASTSFALATPGRYCVKVIDEFEESTRYSSTTCFDVH